MNKIIQPGKILDQLLVPLTKEEKELIVDCLQKTKAREISLKLNPNNKYITNIERLLDKLEE